ncbi:serine/threonine protein kinase [Pseudomarimonas salicorniae]|uniref:Stress response kinase A n=1 Tax=Pseudomarimonas salicorniae TaxID=2933270 RepID=A0ABT0GJU3_9GAMM|nr:serine/threonine protein kinase [Lysobacter sp. CAU 1642]MCK7594819.1 serine/threonine protein kinase [Lysobacter sp. CAU 1642]
MLPALPADDTATPDHPFSGLDPQAVVEALEALGLPCDGRVLALNSYENRVFRVGIEDAAPLIAKFYRPGRWTDAAIAEEQAFAAELAAANVPVVPPLSTHGRSLHPHGIHRIALFPVRGGRAPEMGDRATLTSLGRFLGLLHSVGARRPFSQRISLDIERYGDTALDALLDSPLLPTELADNLAALGDAVLDRVEERLERIDPPMIRLHGDCHAGNVLWLDDAPQFVDLDDCLMGPAVQDLWMLVSGSAEEQREQMDWVLEGYRTFREFDAHELGLIEALRSLRLLHFHAWVCQRWDDPAFPAAFPWFGERRHWERLLQQLQEQLAELQEHSPWDMPD